MIHLGKDVKLNVCPILVTLHHDYVFEGPCRMGKDFELTKEFDDMANAELIKGAHEELAENLTSPHFNVMEPIWIDRNEEFLVTPEILDKMLQERGHEFWWEGNRRADLIRHGKFIQNAIDRGSTTTKPEFVLFPLPQAVINEGKGIIIQNPGY